MKSWIGALSGALGVCVAAAAAFAASPPASAVYVTTFVEVLPGSANAAAADLRDYRAATRREPGTWQRMKRTAPVPRRQCWQTG